MKINPLLTIVMVIILAELQGSKNMSNNVVKLFPERSDNKPENYTEISQDEFKAICLKLERSISAKERMDKMFTGVNSVKIISCTNMVESEMLKIFKEMP